MAIPKKASHSAFQSIHLHYNQCLLLMIFCFTSLFSFLLKSLHLQRAYIHKPNSVPKAIQFRQKWLNHYQFRVGRHATADCSVRLVAETVEHLLVECQSYVTERYCSLCKLTGTVSTGIS